MSKVSGQLIKTLRDKKTVVTKAFFWRITHNSGEADVRLKVGRYKKPTAWLGPEVVECTDPKSELTFDPEEFDALIDFLQENHEPFKEGFKAFIPIDKPFTQSNAEQLRKIFALPERQRLVEFLTEHDLVPADVVASLAQVQRLRAVKEFEQMLAKDEREQKWQEWFQQNSWVLGSDFVRVLDERHIDTRSISDFLMEAYDGFLDVVEIKRPEGGLEFWAANKDHGNYIPSTDLIKAVTQTARYIYEVEREANSVKFLERVGGVRTIKPRAVLIFGRSEAWSSEQVEAYRILNANYHNISIMSYDHVLDRARRIVGYDS
ncbi:MAG: DUF4263 domain-containing protein [Gammaproteobacteria bacterium]|nr:DUF4263 domain-containing protein [Gammaproteobacteria bacterium]